ncbi:uncharacterized protein LOC125040770 [Penaeus chinensis]|uniref:uncharacterized protein LOC125040770 n=1 Tax=Penaeus chinensis TaxID=139456 RepID=UPI001FB722AE|nr:uncharacterized protein LOC125040770 [Penaeus chinensis]
MMVNLASPVSDDLPIRARTNVHDNIGLRDGRVPQRRAGQRPEPGLRVWDAGGVPEALQFKEPLPEPVTAHPHTPLLEALVPCVSDPTGDLGHLPGPSAAAGHRAQPEPDADQLALLDGRGCSSAAVAGGGGRRPLPPPPSLFLRWVGVHRKMGSACSYRRKYFKIYYRVHFVFYNQASLLARAK